MTDEEFDALIAGDLLEVQAKMNPNNDLRYWKDGEFLRETYTQEQLIRVCDRLCEVLDTLGYTDENMETCDRICDIIEWVWFGVTDETRLAQKQKREIVYDR